MNRENAERTMRKILTNFGDTKPKVLMHVCCAPCCSASIERLSELSDTDLFFYNPNIMPEEEYQRRFSELKRFVSEFVPASCSKIIEGERDVESFACIARGRCSQQEGGERCQLCYRLRMRKTALEAQTGGYDFFATTLTISPHKNVDVINAIGRDIEKEVGQKYLPTDFKRLCGVERSRELSREYNLYRQSYCGCILTKND